MQLWHPLHLIPSGLTHWLVLGLLVALLKTYKILSAS